MPSFDTWHLSTLIGLTICVIAIAWSRPLPLALKIPWLYFLTASVWWGFYFPIRPMTFIHVALMLSSLKAFATLIILWHFVYTPERIQIGFKKFIFLAFTLNAIWLMFKGYGIFVGNTHDTAVLAIFLPLVFKDRHFKWVIPIHFAAILYIEGTASYAILVIHALILTAMLLDRWWQYIPIWSAVTGFVCYCAVNPRLTGSRWNVVWREHMVPWYEQANAMIGFGPGSFEWISVTLKDHTEGPKMWMHSDGLQVLFEYGIIGFILFITAYLYIGWQLRRRAYALSTWVALGFGLSLYSPLQFWWVQVLVAMMIRTALSKERQTEYHGTNEC